MKGERPIRQSSEFLCNGTERKTGLVLALNLLECRPHLTATKPSLLEEDGRRMCKSGMRRILGSSRTVRSRTWAMVARRRSRRGKKRRFLKKDAQWRNHPASLLVVEVADTACGSRWTESPCGFKSRPERFCLFYLAGCLSGLRWMT